MLRGMTTACAAIALVLGGARTGKAEKIDEVEKRIADQNKAIKSMSAKMNTVTNMDMGGMKSKSTATGTYEYMLDGDKMFVRSDTKVTSETDVAGNKMKQESTTVGVCDGEFFYSLTDQAGEKFATKSKIPDKPDTDPFKGLRTDYDLKLLTDETVDGKSCWVIEATPKAPKAGANPMAGGKLRHYFQKDTGAMAKNIVFGVDGKPMATTTYSDIQINKPMTRDHFKFSPPPGVKVMDTTQGDGAGAMGKQ